ncbi:ATP-binding cassette domain-containing protein [Gordonia humi]|uniref:ABC-type cobalamin/Fe3+-siderophores transport system ATPase subunit n=1 Tax=Gordonia humi TaxID=686429 RepID=A0A840F5W3_9ACTN|nr:ABC-type cobalamin/Fe3+-siderophores transport system ATPase subunit [Gordonia humi]
MTEPYGAESFSDEAPTVETVLPRETILQARDMQVKASWGHIYGPVDLDIRRGGVTVLVGSGGRGRTALLLTLAGRMKPTAGTLDSFGRRNSAHRLFSRSALGFVDEVDEIEQTIRVHDVLTEQLRWTAPWYKFVGQSTADDLERLCRPVFGPLTLPTLDAYVEELPELTGALFRIAMANIRRPELLVVGGIDNLRNTASAALMLERLIDLGREQTVITADVNGVDPVDGITDVVDVPNLTDDEFVRLEHGDRIV